MKTLSLIQNSCLQLYSYNVCDAQDILFNQHTKPQLCCSGSWPRLKNNNFYSKLWHFDCICSCSH